MADISDDMLVRLADGELDEATAKGLLRQIEGDAALKRRYAIFVKTGKVLSGALAPILSEPVPADVIDVINSFDFERARAARAVRTGTSQRSVVDWLRDILVPAAGPQWALAGYGLAAILGFAAAGLVGGTSGGNIAVADAVIDGQSRAVGDLALALDTKVSGKSAGALKITPRITFRTADGTICRQYVIVPKAGAGGAAQEGVACRTGDAWQVKVVAQSAAPPDGTVPAAEGQSPLINQTVDALISGDALTVEQEQQERTRGWVAPKKTSSE